MRAAVGRIVVGVDRVEQPLRIIQIVDGEALRAALPAGEAVLYREGGVAAGPEVIAGAGVDVAVAVSPVVVQPGAQPGWRGERIDLPARVRAVRVADAAPETHARALGEPQRIVERRQEAEVALVVRGVHLRQGLRPVDALLRAGAAPRVAVAEVDARPYLEGVAPPQEHGHV